MPIPVMYGTFNLNANSSGYYVVKRPMGTAQIIQATSQIARMEGVKKHGEYTAERKISLSVKVIGTSRTDLEAKLDALYLALNQRQQQFSYHLSDSRYFIADALYIPVELGVGDVARAVLTIEIICQQPYALASAASTYNTGIQNLVNGGGYWTFPIGLNITGGGTVFSRPTIVITNQKTSFSGVVLSTGLTSGTAYTSLPLNSPLPSAVATGDILIITAQITPPTNPIHTQRVTVAAPGAAAGATSIPVNSFVANYTYPAPTGGFNPTSTPVTQDVSWSNVSIVQLTDNQYISVSFNPGMVGNQLTIVCDRLLSNGWSAVDSGNPLVNVLFAGYPPEQPVATTQWYMTFASNTSNPIAQAQWTWTPRYLS